MIPDVSLTTIVTQGSALTNEGWCHDIMVMVADGQEPLPLF